MGQDVISDLVLDIFLINTIYCIELLRVYIYIHSLSSLMQIFFYCYHFSCVYGNFFRQGLSSHNIWKYCYKTYFCFLLLLDPSMQASLLFVCFAKMNLIFQFSKRIEVKNQRVFIVCKYVSQSILIMNFIFRNIFNTNLKILRL